MTHKHLWVIVLMGIGIGGYAGELVYQPKSPALGGNPLNGNWILNQAQAQMTFVDKSRSSARDQESALDRFAKSLQRQLLGQLSRKLTASLFGGRNGLSGEEGLEEGRYELGNFVVDIFPGDDGMNINIFDASNGSETNIVVPFF